MILNEITFIYKIRITQLTIGNLSRSYTFLYSDILEIMLLYQKNNKPTLLMQKGQVEHKLWQHFYVLSIWVVFHLRYEYELRFWQLLFGQKSKRHVYPKTLIIKCFWFLKIYAKLIRILSLRCKIIGPTRLSIFVYFF